jgi:hypothetical protein
LRYVAYQPTTDNPHSASDVASAALANLFIRYLELCEDNKDKSKIAAFKKELGSFLCRLLKLLALFSDETNQKKGSDQMEY